MLIYYVSTCHGYLRVFVCTQKARNTQKIFYQRDYTDYTDFKQEEYMIGGYGRTECVLNHANFQQVNFQLMKDARAHRKYKIQVFNHYAVS